MNTQRFAATASMVALLALTGFGCKGALNDSSSKKSSNDSVFSTKSDDDEKPSAKDAYKESSDLELEQNDNSRELKSIVEKVFGNVKTSSFSQYPTPNSITAEYQASREIKNADVNEVINTLKAKGYKIDFSGVADGSAAINATSKDNYVWITFSIGESKVGAIITPIDEATGNQE